MGCLRKCFVWFFHSAARNGNSVSPPPHKFTAHPAPAHQGKRLPSQTATPLARATFAWGPHRSEPPENPGAGDIPRGHDRLPRDKQDAETSEEEVSAGVPGWNFVSDEKGVWMHEEWLNSEFKTY